MGYYRWCDRWLERWTTWAVIPDVIEGDESANDALIAEWPHGTRGAPVWHLHERLERLVDLCSAWPLVCIGSSGEFSVIGSTLWARRMAHAMDAVCCDGVPITRLHMLRGMALSRGPYPFFSADSTNIARNHKGDNGGRRARSIEAMADEWDGHQPAVRWRHEGHQLELTNGLTMKGEAS